MRCVAQSAFRKEGRVNQCLGAQADFRPTRARSGRTCQNFAKRGLNSAEMRPKLVDTARIRSKCAQTLGKSDPHRPAIHQSLAEFDQLRPRDQPTSANIGLDSADLGPNVRLRPTSTKVGPPSANMRQTTLGTDHTGPGFGQIRPESGQLWPNTSHARSNFGRSRPTVAPKRPALAQARPEVGPARRGIGRHPSD